MVHRKRISVQLFGLDYSYSVHTISIVQLQLYGKLLLLYANCMAYPVKILLTCIKKEEVVNNLKRGNNLITLNETIIYFQGVIKFLQNICVPYVHATRIHKIKQVTTNLELVLIILGMNGIRQTMSVQSRQVTVLFIYFVLKLSLDIIAYNVRQ